MYSTKNGIVGYRSAEYVDRFKLCMWLTFENKKSKVGRRRGNEEEQNQTQGGACEKAEGGRRAGSLGKGFARGSALRGGRRRRRYSQDHPTVPSQSEQAKVRMLRRGAGNVQYGQSLLAVRQGHRRMDEFSDEPFGNRTKYVQSHPEVRFRKTHGTEESQQRGRRGDFERQLGQSYRPEANRKKVGGEVWFLPSLFYL